MIARDGLPGAWIVGGALRDRALSRDVSEIDVAVSGDAGAVARALQSGGFGRAFLLSGDKAPRVFRVAGRRRILDVAEIEGASIGTDLARRDFTVNAMALDLESGALLDPFGGLADLDRGRLSMVSESNLADDPLRCLRAARLAATHGFEPDRATSAACGRAAPGIAGVARERVQAELARLLEARKAVPALGWAHRNGVLQPSLGVEIPAAMWSRLARRLSALDSLPLRRLPGDRRRLLRLALIADAADFPPSAASSWLRRLRWSSELASEVAQLLELATVARAPLSDDEAWRWILRAGDRAPDALRFLRLTAPRSRRVAQALSARLRRKRRGPDVSGADVLEWLGISPGPHVGRLLEAVRVQGLAGRIRTRADARKWLTKSQAGGSPAPGRGRQGPGSAAL